MLVFFLQCLLNGMTATLYDWVLSLKHKLSMDEISLKRTVTVDWELYDESDRNVKDLC